MSSGKTRGEKNAFIENTNSIPATGLGLHFPASGKTNQNQNPYGYL